MKFSTIALTLLVAGIHSMPAKIASSGITVNPGTGTTNVGGESGITQKPDGSTSVGGESGINTPATGATPGNGTNAPAAGGNNNGTDQLAGLIGALEGVSNKGNGTSGAAKATGTGGAKPKGTGNVNAPPGSNDDLTAIFGALEGARRRV